MAQKDIKVAYGIDVDAVAGWLGSYGGEDSPDDISRGMFAGKAGCRSTFTPHLYFARDGAAADRTLPTGFSTSPWRST